MKSIQSIAIKASMLAAMTVLASAASMDALMAMLFMLFMKIPLCLRQSLHSVAVSYTHLTLPTIYSV